MGSNVQMPQQQQAVYGVFLLPKSQTVLNDSIHELRQGCFNYRKYSDQLLVQILLPELFDLGIPAFLQSFHGRGPGNVCI